MQLTFVNPKGELTCYDNLYTFYHGPMLEDVTDPMYSTRLRFIKETLTSGHPDSYPSNYTFYIVESDLEKDCQDIKTFLRTLLYKTKDVTPFVIFAPQLAPKYEGKSVGVRWTRGQGALPSIFLRKESPFYKLAPKPVRAAPILANTLWKEKMFRKSFHDPENAKIFKRVGHHSACTNLSSKEGVPRGFFLWGFSLAAMLEKLEITRDAEPTSFPICFVFYAYPESLVQEPRHAPREYSAILDYLGRVIKYFIRERGKITALHKSIGQEDTSEIWDKLFDISVLEELEELKKEKETKLCHIKQCQTYLNDALENYAEVLSQMDLIEKSPLSALPDTEKSGLIHLSKNCFLSISIAEKGTILTCRTKPLRMAPRYEHFILEPLDITISLKTGGIKFNSLKESSGLKRDETLRIQHPHIWSDGKACFGNLSSTLGQLFIEKRLLEGLTLLIRFLRTYTPSDSVQSLNSLESFPIEEFGDLANVI